MLSITIPTGQSYNLPPEVLLNIVFQACDYACWDSDTLWDLCSINKLYHDVMAANRQIIINRYTIRIANADGDTALLLYGYYHSINDEPSVAWADGTMCWHRHGILNRDGDKYTVKDSDGTLKWHVNGNLHRVDKPAIIWPDKSRSYYIHGRYIKTEGPSN